MATIGNLELKYNENIYCASTTHDGYMVYELIPRLLNFLFSIKNPKKEQFKEWFRSTSKELIPYNYSIKLLGGSPEEVIIDIPRRLILHTGEESNYELISDSFSKKFKKSCIVLEKEYNFEILNYYTLSLRKFLTENKY